MGRDWPVKSRNRKLRTDAEVRRIHDAQRHDVERDAAAGQCGQSGPEIEEQPSKDIAKYGTGSFDCTLTEQGLIDEFHFSIFPVVVGTGRRLK